jgi:hypothetical protein
MLDSFQALVGESARLLGPASRLGTADERMGATQLSRFDVEGVAFFLWYQPSRTSDGFLVYCDFGPLPTGLDEAVVLRRLLEVNFRMFSGRSPTFTINPDDGRVTLCYEAMLSGAVAEVFVASLKDVAGRAREWREARFLGVSVPEGVTLA